MKKVLVIGIGVGDPDQLTVQAVQALNRIDVFFVMDKGPAKTKLRALREEILRRHIKDRTLSRRRSAQPAARYRARRLPRLRRRAEPGQAGRVREADRAR